jgi:8-hydroxy-5-deazaflavin:NADPH oxidoreductase
MTTIGFIGAGRIGTNLAAAALAVGHDVVMSNARGVESLRPLVRQLGPGARAASPAEAAEAADVAVVCIPLHQVGTVPVDELSGKVVIDTINYYPERDGSIAELDAGTTTVSEMLQRRLDSAAEPGRVGKAFNHIRADLIVTQARPAGSDDRRALAVFADDTSGAAWVAGFIEQLGFDAVVGGGTPGYDARLGAAALRRALEGARRGAD